MDLFFPVGKHTYESLISGESTIVWERNYEVASIQMPSNLAWSIRPVDNIAASARIEDDGDHGQQSRWKWCGFEVYEDKRDVYGSTVKAWLFQY